MSTVLTLLRKDIALFRRDRTALALTFIVPVVMMYVFGLVFGITRTDTGPSGIPLAVVNECENPVAQKLVEALRDEKGFKLITTTTAPDGKERPLVSADLKPLMRDNEFRFAIVIPADLVGTGKMGVNLKLLSNPRNEIETQIVSGLLQKSIFSNVPQLLGQSMQQNMKSRLGGAGQDKFNRNIAGAVSESFGMQETDVLRDIETGNFGFGTISATAAAPDEKPENGMRELGATSESAGVKTASKSTNPFAGLIHIESEQVIGNDIKSPAIARNIGGWAIMFLLFTLSHTAGALFEEKRAGLFQRLMSSRVRPSQVLWSKFFFGVLLGLVQLLALFFAGRILFGLDVTSHLGMLALVCVCAATACTGFGMLIASLAKTPAVANSMTTLLVLVMSCCGGAWMPIALMPEVIQKVARFTIPYWAIEGFMQVFWSGDSLARILPTLGILCAIGAGTVSIAWWRFKRGTIFEP